MSVSSSSASNLPSASGSGSSVVSGVIAPVVAEVQPLGSIIIFKHEVKSQDIYQKFNIL